MSLIGGVKREQIQFEQTDFVKKVGLFEDGFIYDGEEYYNQTYNQNK